MPKPIRASAHATGRTSIMDRLKTRRPNKDEAEDEKKTLVKETADTEKTLAAIPSKVKEMAKAENQRREDMLNTQYYLVLCFASNQQMLEFTSKAKIEDDVDREQFMDGRIIAKKLGISLADDRRVVRRINHNPRWEARVKKDM